MLPARWAGLSGPLALILTGFVLTYPLRLFQAALQGLQDLAFVGGMNFIGWTAGTAHEVVFPTLLRQQMALRTAADWVIRPRLLKVPGVAEVFVQGGDRKQYQVLVDPAALLEYGVTLQQVLRGFFHATNYLKIDVAKSKTADMLIDALETALLDDLADVRMAVVWPLAWMHR